MKFEPDLIINAAGLLNKGTEKVVADTILLDAYFPNFLAENFAKTKTRLFHISTDCVFSGRQGSYNEDSVRDGDTVYDRAKALGEIINSKDLTLRQSIVGPELREKGTGLLHWALTQRGSIHGFTNAIWNGVTTLELAKSIELYFKNNTVGLVHTVSVPALSKYEMIKVFIKEFHLSHLDLKATEMTPSLDKTLVNTRTDLPVVSKNFEQQVHELHQWMQSHPDFYRHYNIV
jgi:dTDP-4-dehydrorhamnose reductase